MKKSVSIIIPIYAVEKHIERCLSSVFRQDYDGSIECILVDDDTPDKSMAIVSKLLESYGGKIAFKVLHHKSNAGLSTARNTGLRAASGDYVYFIDSDDEVMPEAISSLVALADKHDGVDVVYGDWYTASCNNVVQNSSGLPEYTTDKEKIADYIISNKVSVTAQNKLLKRDFLLNNQLFFKEGLLHEDVLFSYMLSEKLHSMAISYVPVYVYYHNTKGIMNSPMTEKKVRSRIVIAKEVLDLGASPRRFNYGIGSLLCAKRTADSSMNVDAEINAEFRRIAKVAWASKYRSTALRAFLYSKYSPKVVQRIIKIKRLFLLRF